MREREREDNGDMNTQRYGGRDRETERERESARVLLFVPSNRV